MIIINCMEHFQILCRLKLVEWYNSQTNPLFEKISLDNTFILWSCKTLQNYKCMVSTNLIDGIYAEYTYNGDKHELYEDVYKKLSNNCLTTED